ncbi:TlpA family protein disulfide reductase [Geoalkalibacter halelectricus]|uniref:TlpA family protein disulfide reductase n=1 Tax=Geoalkalibacter halelectricus TaxID=2847045 RepID=A0ABY5ZKS3_9BACT|nr:TlpA disulfide reductase family protein [Geoalkalibacter halelectricus]MDO3379607.1 TlpA family protein disulfide reductase [Geoalkalibacter halelectricus]UWZ78577.1 TlpA family protein disulfide reductase [Geoalkalibacter halelectricus]
MRRFLPVLVVLALVAGALLVMGGAPKPDAPPAPSVRVGTVAPDFTLNTYGGDSVTLSHLRGKVVLINFWATWCPPCRAEKPTLEKLNQRFGHREDFELLAINVEEDPHRALATYLEANPYSFTIPIDPQGRVQELYRVYRFPETFIVDRNGIVVDHVIGGRDWTDSRVIEHISRLLAD